jgi:predicted transcriptional regulator
MDFWNGHDLSGIPSHLLLRLGDLSGGKLYCGSVDDPLESQRAFMDAVAGSKRVWGVSPVIAPGYERMILDLLESGADVRLLLNESVLVKVPPASVQAAMAHKNFEVRVTKLERLPAFAVTDKRVSLALFGQDGRYDATQDLITEGARAVAWGSELFHYYSGL